MTQPNLLVERDRAIVRLTLNRPDKGNALDLSMGQALFAAATRCDQDDSVRCVVLTGAGRMFCAGGDVAPFASAGEDLPALIHESASTLHLAMARFARMAKPLVVLVNGPAAGAGVGLAIAGDIVLAARSAHFTAAYGMLGLTPDSGITWLLPRLVGMRRAQEIILTNRRVPAEEAESFGLVSRVVEDDALERDGMKTASILSSGPTGALAAVRELLLQTFGNGLETQMELEARAMAQAARGGDVREGLAAFIERRKPSFSGT
jgi:2-(1,2-epoxy-1,2-dihydrophenyl)acetyl-CoA isomerase